METTALRCACCLSSVVAVAHMEEGMIELSRHVHEYTRTEDGVLELQKKAHGSWHGRKLTLADLVTLLDPHGTSYTRVMEGTRA